MPVLASDIWRLKSFVGEAISQSINQKVNSNMMTVESIVDKGGGLYELSGEFSYYDYNTNEYKYGDFESAVSTNGIVSTLKIKGKSII